MAIIEIKNLKKVFITKTDKLVALQDINLSIEKGEIFGIIGLSGAGKSTLVRMINFLETPTEGDVYFEDKYWCIKRIRTSEHKKRNRNDISKL